MTFGPQWIVRHGLLLHVLFAAVSVREVRSEEPSEAPFRVGAAVVDVSPLTFPVAVNGSMTARFAERVETPVNARAIVVAQGDAPIAMVVVDSCMLPRDLLDEVKAMAAARTGIAKDRIMISATHTHSAPAAMSCLGTDGDPDYRSLLRNRICEAICKAQENLEPARVGWGSIDASDYMAVRRWIRRPDRIAIDPFGNPTVRANMHAARNWDDVTGPSGPEDPELSLIAFESLDGRPIAVLANLSMHYFSGVRPISADYFGLFCNAIASRLAPSTDGDPMVVGVLSHGCSGDVWRMDYSGQTPERFKTISIENYTEGLIGLAMQAYREIEFVEAPTIDMAERRIDLRYRVPDFQLLQWARQIVDTMGDRLPETTEEVYAREQIYLHELQSTEVVVQAIRIGEIAIATTPTETYALTGLKLKHQSPLARTMVIELAGGGDGYIPPPEQHLLGGYNTWPARSAGLEVTAEPKIVETAIGLLEQVSGRSRKSYRQTLGHQALKILEEEPLAFWRMDEMSGPRARDASGNNRDGIYEPGVAFFLDGPQSQAFNQDGELNRSTHFAGGRMRARLGTHPPSYGVSMWIWNGMPTDAREVTGWFYSRGSDFGRPPLAEQLGVGRGDGNSGRLILQLGADEPVSGKTEIQRWTWTQVRLERNPSSIRVFVDGSEAPDIVLSVSGEVPTWADEWFFGGSSDGQFNWEGKLDEIAIVPLP